ncbi:hypothetical protein PCA20602_01593 [Pandoraea capi]|uniref:Uncharacterized protein n=1 Tax=Pandoraea capi TaxID=2508286 RepID=A0ABY6VUI4_9BURK|nr:hypothetical protein PCA20602_01593 [Pandoraea capi]
MSCQPHHSASSGRACCVAISCPESAACPGQPPTVCGDPMRGKRIASDIRAWMPFAQIPVERWSRIARRWQHPAAHLNGTGRHIRRGRTRRQCLRLAAWRGVWRGWIATRAIGTTRASGARARVGDRFGRRRCDGGHAARAAHTSRRSQGPHTHDICAQRVMPSLHTTWRLRLGTAQVLPIGDALQRAQVLLRIDATHGEQPDARALLPCHHGGH